MGNVTAHHFRLPCSTDGLICTACTCILLTSLYHVQCALLANSAGIGGGPFYVPLLTVVLGFDLKAATGLSHTIVGKPALSAAGSAGMRVKLLQTNTDKLLQSAARAS